ncbi:MAG: YdcF family protein, partial [Hyphomicrobiales bacterium]|nr:YdcF family protein [Hyphomicrobiales bacterium]
MFFVASKVLWFVAAPGSFLLLAAIASALFVPRKVGAPRIVALVCLGALLVLSVAPVGALLIEPLEDRFPPPPADMPAPYGIVILGGAIDDEASVIRGQTTFDDAAARLTEAAILARRYPSARVLYTGGSASLTGRNSAEAAEGRKLLIGLGIEPARIEIEDKSRNTDENARFSAAIEHPKSDQPWLVVTSAYHMPRSMGLFRKAGFAAVAYPVDYQSLGGWRDWRLIADPVRGLRVVDLAVHEWIGLL